MGWMNVGEGVSRLPRLLVKGEFRYGFDGMPLRATGLSAAKRWNLLKSGLDQALRRERMSSLPPTVQIEPTNLCNLKCPLCPTGSGNPLRPQGMMSLETFHRIMAELGNVLVGVVIYGWGEPFLNRATPEMIAECSRRGIVTVTSTNGQCLQTAEEAERVVASGLRGLVIAIDGSSQEVYEAYRKAGSVDKVKRCAENIEAAKARLKSPTPYTNLRVVVTQKNKDDLENLRALARQLGVNMFSSKTVGCLTTAPDYSTYETQPQDLRRFEYKDRDRVHHAPIRCPYPFRQPTIFWDGTFVGCEFDYDLKLAWGNIRTDSVRAMWNSPRAQTLRRQIRRGPARPAFCSRCPYQDRTRDTCVIGCEELRPPVAEAR